MMTEIPFPQDTGPAVTDGTSQKFIVSEVPNLFADDGLEIVDRFDMASRLHRESRDHDKVFTDEFGVELEAHREHYRFIKKCKPEVEKSPYLSPAVVSGMADAEARVPENCLEGAGTILKGRGAPRHSVATLAYALAYMEADLRVIDVHAFDKNDGAACTCMFGDKTWCSGSPGKHPRGGNWQLRASKSWETVRSWWDGTGRYDVEDEDGERKRMAGASAHRNVGIVFAEGDGLFAVDVDGEKGKAGLAELEARNGALPPTATSISGSGTGYHKLFRVPVEIDIRNSASALAPGVDIRGNGGFIVAPPSLHHSGNLYRWEDGLAPWEVEIADAPQWLIDLALKSAKALPTEKKAKTGPRRKQGPAKPNDHTIKVGRTFEERLAQIGDGEGQLGFHGPIYAAAIQFFREELNED